MFTPHERKALVPQITSSCPLEAVFAYRVIALRQESRPNGRHSKAAN